MEALTYETCLKRPAFYDLGKSCSDVGNSSATEKDRETIRVAVPPGRHRLPHGSTVFGPNTKRHHRRPGKRDGRIGESQYDGIMPTGDRFL